MDWQAEIRAKAVPTPEEGTPVLPLQYEVEELRGKLRFMKAAVERVEWVKHWFGLAYCPSCFRYETTKHAEDCMTKLALQMEVEGERQVDGQGGE